ncbi:MAG: sporulation transcriptional regulator SpoIIID [Oscillospiraceae bacterium]
MKGLPEERAVAAAEYIIENKATVRAAAKQFGVSKSTVHKDVSERLAKISPGLYRDVKSVLERNKLERHLRGGEATKQKYEQIRAKG